MTVDAYVHEALARIPKGARRMQIEMDLRAHLAERVDQGQSVDEAIRQFGDPETLADSYLSAIPLVSASFMRRAAAKLIDFGALAAVGCALAWLAWRLTGSPGGAFFPGVLEAIGPALIAVCVFMFVLLIPGYFIFAEYLTDQTLGKRALGIHVVRESGARISLGQSFVRQLPLMAEIFVLDVVFALFTEKNQRAFELITKTRCVRVEDA